MPRPTADRPGRVTPARGHRHRGPARLVVALMSAALALAACSGGSNSVDQSAGGDFRFVGATPKGHTIAPGKRKLAGPVAAPYLDGKQFTLAALRGHVVVLNYWAHWCAPCVSETPGLERTYEANKAAGVDVIGVAVKDDARGALHSFVKQHQVTYPIVYDVIAHTAVQLGNIPTFGLPSTVIIDRQGKVAAVYTGLVLQGDLQPVLTALAGEK